MRDRKPSRRWVEVRDAGNIKRLLGEIAVPSRYTASNAPIYVVPCMSPARATTRMTAMEALKPVPNVEFRVGQVHDYDNWVSRFVLTTDAPLSLLRQCDGFRLPDERETSFDIAEEWKREANRAWCFRCHRAHTHCRCEF